MKIDDPKNILDMTIDELRVIKGQKVKATGTENVYTFDVGFDYSGCTLRQLIMAANKSLMIQVQAVLRANEELAAEHMDQFESEGVPAVFSAKRMLSSVSAKPSVPAWAETVD